MNRPSLLWPRLLGALNVIGIAAVAVLYGAAYGCIGFYISLFIDALGAAEHWVTVWLLAWVAFGAVVLTVWAIRWTGIGADWFRQDNNRTTDTFTREGATRWP